MNGIMRVSFLLAILVTPAVALQSLEREWVSPVEGLRGATLRSVNVLDELIIVADGSGLSRTNRVAAATFTAWLHTFLSDDPVGSVFVQSLAVGGQSGTLKNRFRNIDLQGAVVRAKSGYIKHVSCLSGYVITPDGRARSFSILVNGLREPDAVSHAKKMQESIVSAIAWDMATTVVQVGGG